MDVQLPNGQTITIDIPVEFQINEDGTPKVNRPATSRNWQGECQNVVMVYPYSNDPFTQLNVQNIIIGFPGTSIFGGVNKYTTSGSTALDPGDIIRINVNSSNDYSGCNDITVIVGSWNCSGGKFDFLQMDFVGDISGLKIGSLNICHDKCGLNPEWSTFNNSGC